MKEQFYVCAVEDMKQDEKYSLIVKRKVSGYMDTYPECLNWLESSASTGNYSIEKIFAVD